MPHFLTVRATVADASKRKAFDEWYSREHLPDAVKTFGAQKAWRHWSESDPAVHQATYQLPDRAALDRAVSGDGMKRLVADFDKDWPGIPRQREILTLVEELGE
jgi:hypothetical protein